MALAGGRDVHNSADIVSNDTRAETPTRNAPREPDDYKHYVYLMPKKLQHYDNDFLIICSPRDYDAAFGFKMHLANDIHCEVNKSLISPRVQLLDGFFGTENEPFETILQRSTYVFLFLTDYFCEEQEQAASHACLYQMLHIPGKMGSVIPVHTEQYGKRKYKTPWILKAIKSIEYLRGDQFYKDAIVEMFVKKAPERLKKESCLDKRRRDYFFQHKEELISKANRVNNQISSTCASAQSCFRNYSNNISESPSQIAIDSRLPHSCASSNENNDSFDQRSCGTSDFDSMSAQEAHSASEFEFQSSETGEPSPEGSLISSRTDGIVQNNYYISAETVVIGNCCTINDQSA